MAEEKKYLDLADGMEIYMRAKGYAREEIDKAVDYIMGVIEGGGVPVAPDSVGTEEIKNGSIIMEDLNQEVKDKMTHTYDESNESLTIGG